MKTKNFNLMMLSVTFGLSLVLSFGLNLWLQYANTDIVLYASILPKVLGALIELCEIAIYSFAFALIIGTIYLGKPLSTSIGLGAILSGACLFRRLCDLASILIVFGVLDIVDLIIEITYLLLDLILVWILLLVICRQLKHYIRMKAVKGKSSTLFTDDTAYIPNRSDFFPFKKTFLKTNPIQVSLLTISIIRSAVKIFTRIVRDIGYGAPESFKEVMIMLVYYLSDLLVGVLFYAVAILVLEKIFKRARHLNQ